MNNVARTMVEAEQKLGLDSLLIDIQKDESWEHALDVDIHVSHTHVPVIYKGKAWKKQVTKPFKLVTLFHGTPEHMFEGSVSAGEKGAYAPSNALMIMQRDLKVADARVTCWERHQAIYETMVDKGTKVHCVPLGVDKEFWAAGASRGKYQGNPSLWSGENCHTIKWPLDLLTLWPWVSEEIDDAYLHCCYVPFDQHRYWFPLIHAGAVILPGVRIGAGAMIGAGAVVTKDVRPHEHVRGEPARVRSYSQIHESVNRLVAENAAPWPGVRGS